MGNFDFTQTWLWRNTFVKPIAGISVEEQDYFRINYLEMREKASMLVSQINGAIPGLTVHDISHLDALWSIASLLIEGAMTLTPAEGFVFGASILLHDSAMSLGAYPGGIKDLEKTIEWKDIVAGLMSERNIEGAAFNLDNPPEDIVKLAIPMALRQLHATQAETLATQGWKISGNDTCYLIDNLELRNFYGNTIGKIAHSHWWSVDKIELELSEDLGAFPGKTKCSIDRVKLACLLRLSDALHIDQLRAPHFLRAISNPQGLSAIHWNFQQKLALPRIEHEEVIFTSSSPFELSEAESWWLAYDTISAINKELLDVDLLMQSRSRGQYFMARRVKGCGNPESFSKTITVKGWRPIDAQFKITNIPKVIETLGGDQLYGKRPSTVLRELIQNSSDSIQARRKYQNRDCLWGQITISLKKNDSQYWLIIEDTGIGMSERVMTGPLIDFGSSFWRSSMATQEFPGLIAKGMNATGRYGIGFFSVFMIADNVRVISKRYDKSDDSACVLEFKQGGNSRPMIYQALKDEIPLDGGTRVELLLKIPPNLPGGLLFDDYLYGHDMTLDYLVSKIAPSLDVSINIIEGDTLVPTVIANDWLSISEKKLIERTMILGRYGPPILKSINESGNGFTILKDSDGVIYGRARIHIGSYFHSHGIVTIGGLTASKMSNIQGILLGDAITVLRDTAIPKIPYSILSEWATEQRKFIESSNFSDEDKLDYADIILQCGGDIGSLPIVRVGEDKWLNTVEFAEFVSNSSRLILVDNKNLSYSESEDDVLERDFSYYFKMYDDIVSLNGRSARILETDNDVWPSMLVNDFNGPVFGMNELITQCILSVWGEEYDEEKDKIIIGDVNGVEITRQVTYLTKH
ncbi:ATP-binding protein [Serratia fonticola]|uniref:HD domain-containing protein n=1 Tax=Serratia fonticola TaxID=47917 RepID=UPI00209696E3|nr:ATP-binding protein [Serratia fonticola]MCO7507885.1 ATP-binding protein [Serratia fonticola]